MRFTLLSLLMIPLAIGCGDANKDDDDDDGAWSSDEAGSTGWGTTGGGGTGGSTGGGTSGGATEGGTSGGGTSGGGSSGGGGSTTGGGDVSLDDLSDWALSSTSTTFVRASDGELAWRIVRNECDTEDAETVCNYTVTLTGNVGRRCSTCDDQTVDLTLRQKSTGQIELDSVRLTAGSGIPLGIAFENLDIPLVPEPPHERNDPTVLESIFLAPGGYGSLFGIWVLVEQYESFTDHSGRRYAKCNTFEIGSDAAGWFIRPDFDELEDAARVTSCEGRGIVQVEILEPERPEDDTGLEAPVTTPGLDGDDDEGDGDEGDGDEGDGDEGDEGSGDDGSGEDDEGDDTGAAKSGGPSKSTEARNVYIRG